MAYPHNFLRLAVSGTGPETETWAYGLSLASFTTGTNAPDVPAVPAAVVDAVTALHSATIIGADAKITTIKLNEIGPDGRYVSRTDTVQHEFTPAWSYAGARTNLPLQAAVAVTLLTQNSRGPASRGRFFLPYPTHSVQNGRFGADYVQGVASAAADFIEALNDALDPYVVCVASKVRTGAFAAVNRIAVGDRPDTIRSRGGAIAEAYTVANIAGQTP